MTTYFNDPRLVFDEAAHTYRWEGRLIPGVTSIIKDVLPGVYGDIPLHVLERKARLGTAVHKAIELAVADELDESSLHPDVVPYFRSWLKWWLAQDVVVGACEFEQKFYSEAGYCGQIDFRGCLGSGRWVLDWKTTTKPQPTHCVQLAAYACADEYEAVRRGCVYLRRDGEKAELKEYTNPDDCADWFAILRVLKMKEGFK